MRDEAALYILVLLTVRLEVWSANPLVKLILELQLRYILSRLLQGWHALGLVLLPGGVRLLYAEQLAVVGPQTIQFFKMGLLHLIKAVHIQHCTCSCANAS